MSLVLINTEKGRELFEAVKDRMTIIPAKLEDCLQPNLQHPSVIHPQRMEFERDYQRKGFLYVMKRYGDMGWRYKVRKVNRKMKQMVKKNPWQEMMISFKNLEIRAELLIFVLSGIYKTGRNIL